jgi:hypothetical protein
MRCDNARENLTAALDRELNWPARLALRAHLLHCPACRAEAGRLKALAQQLTALPAPPPQEATRTAVLAAAREGVPAARPARSRLVVSAAGAVLLAVLAFLFLTRPTPAQAEYIRMLTATGEVRSAHMAWHIAQPNTNSFEEHATWYADGKWRIELHRDHVMAEVLVYDGKRRDTYDAPANCVRLNIPGSPFGTPFRGFTVDTMFGEAGDREVTVEEITSAEGRALNRFTITNAGPGERSIVDADPQTNLPVRFELQYRAGLWWKTIGESDVVEFSTALDPKLFVLDYPVNAEVIDEEAVRTAWRQRYDAGLMRTTVGGREAVLRDFQVTTGGDVFAIWTWEGWVGPAQVGDPGLVRTDQAEGVGLTDSLGTEYLTDESGRGAFQAWDKPCAWFVPRRPPTQTPSWYLLTFRAQGRTFSFRMTDPIHSPSPDPTYPMFSTKRGEAGLLYPQGEGAEKMRAEIRAQGR